ncbi:hypothetical protein CPLU01_13792 [Colletotrichum plurivorum]|uniref:Uncharacterized protein n=1 Tax=Colletotrichum plurivorum TaxID=2175906 RepID=A0A8H6N243_9PEZI|nr:hypothetical protein CPLU01_13792 [Colletotrichum plurivorum]
MAPTILPRDSTIDLDRHYQIINGLIVVCVVAAGLLAGLIDSWVRHAKKNAELRKLQADLDRKINTIFYCDRVIDEYIRRHGKLPESFLDTAEKYPALHDMPQNLQLQSIAPPNFPTPVQPAAQNTLTRNDNGVMRAQASTSIRDSVARGCETVRRVLTRPAQPAANTERRTEAAPYNERVERVRQRDEEEQFAIGRDSKDSERGAPRETIRSVPAAGVRGESSSRAGSSGRGPASASGSRQASLSPRAPVSAPGQGSGSSRHARFTEGV